mgnify:CR=1 FL=1
MASSTMLIRNFSDLEDFKRTLRTPQSVLDAEAAMGLDGMDDALDEYYYECNSRGEPDEW